MTPDMPAEEPWEAEISGLLRGLPSVEPPEGFLASAANHRPLYAGRVLAGLMLTVGLAFGAMAATGLADRTSVRPALDTFAERHLAAQAGLRSFAEQRGTVDNMVDNGADDPVDDVVVMPDGFEKMAIASADDLRQAVYEREGTAVSVFVQDGTIDWAELDDVGRHELSGHPAWSDPVNDVTVLQIGDEAVTIIGLSSTEVSDIITDLPSGSRSIPGRMVDLANSLSGHLGFPQD